MLMLGHEPTLIRTKTKNHLAFIRGIRVGPWQGFCLPWLPTLEVQSDAGSDGNLEQYLSERGC